MRRRARKLSALLLVVVALPWVFRHLTTPRLAAPSAGLRVPVAVLHAERWTSFELPVGTDHLRIVSHASVAPGPSDGETALRYAIAYRIEAGDGLALAEGVRHERVADPRPDQGAGAYQEVDRVPSLGQLLELKLDSSARPARLKLKLASKTPPVLDAVARVFRREQVSARRVRFRWQRLSAEEREELAASNVFPAAVMRPAERREATRYRWLRIAPAGRGDAPGDRRTLVLWDEAARPLPPAVPRPLPPARVEPGLALTLALREEAVGLVLRLEPIASRPARGGGLTLRWVGGEPARAELHERSLEAAGGEIRIPLEGGRVRLDSEAGPWRVTAVELSAAGERAVDLEPRRVPAWLARGAESVELAVHHVGDCPTPVRLDLRVAGTAQAGAAEGLVTLLGADRRVLREARVAIPREASRLDRLEGEALDEPVSEPARFYLNAPAAVRTIRVTSLGEPLYITAFNRPPCWAARRRLPEDRNARDADDDDEEVETSRSWFPLRPSGEAELAAAERRRLVRWQLRLAELKEPPNARFVSLRPLGEPPARLVYLAPDAGAGAANEAGSRAFVALEPGATVKLRFAGEAGRSWVVPELVYRKPSREPLALAVLSGSRRLETALLTGHVGKLRLPALAEGPHELRAEAKGPVALFVSGVTGSAPAARSERLAYRLGPECLRFAVDKRASEVTLLARLFVAEPARERLELSVWIDGAERGSLELAPDYTPRERRIDLRPGEGEPVFASGMAGELAAGRRLLVRLGADLPEGPYHVRYCGRSEPQAWMTLSRPHPEPGTPDEPELFVEHMESAKRASVTSLAPAGAESLRSAWERSAEQGDWRAPSAPELARAEALFARTMDAGFEDLAALCSAWAELGFELRRVELAREPALALGEHGERREGRGFYVIRAAAAASSVVLQAPHRFRDLGSGRIALELCEQGRARVCAWNTVRASEADLAHLGASHFLAFTRVLMEREPGLVVAQIHGFERRKRTSQAGRAAELILSSGREIPGARVERLASRLGALGLRVQKYGPDVDELGATTNTIGRMLNARAADGFLHLELSRELRRRLAVDAELRAGLARSLDEVAP